MIARCTRALRKQVLHFLSSSSLVNVVEAQRELPRGGPEIKLIVGAARVLQLSRALSCCPVTLWVAVPASMLVRPASDACALPQTDISSGRVTRYRDCDT